MVFFPGVDISLISHSERKVGEDGVCFNSPQDSKAH